jgi:hypothetical protein
MVGTQLSLTLWRLRRALDYASPALLVAAGLIASEIVFYFGVIGPQSIKKMELREDALRRRQPIGEMTHLVPTQTLTDDMAAFYKTLPSTARAAKMLRRLHEIASDEGVFVEQGEYHPISDPDTRVVRYQITLPIRGAYPEIQHFLGRAVHEIPGLAINGVGFQRQRIGEAELDAQIKLTLFLSAASTSLSGRADQAPR